MVALNLMCSIIKILYLKYCPFLMYKMSVLSKLRPHSDAVYYFKELPFYNKPIEKPKVKCLKNIDRLAELPFYEQLSVIKQIKSIEDMQCHTKLK